MPLRIWILRPESLDIGYLDPVFLRFPGFDSVPSGLAASITAPGSYGFVALFAVAGILELGAWTESPDKEASGSAGSPLKGPSSQYLRTLVSKSISLMVFGTRVLKDWVLGPTAEVPVSL